MSDAGKRLVQMIRCKTVMRTLLTLAILSQLTAAALYVIRSRVRGLPPPLGRAGPLPDVVLVKPTTRGDDASLDRLHRWIESARGYPGRANVVVTTLASLAPRIIESLGSPPPPDVHVVAQSDEQRRREVGLDKAHRLVAAEELFDALLAGRDGVIVSSDDDVNPLDRHCVERLVAAAPHPGATATVTHAAAPRNDPPWWQAIAHATFAFNNQVFATNAAFFERFHGLILGWTTVIWRSDLRAIGGFGAATRHLTEDVVLGNLLAQHNIRTRLFSPEGAFEIVESSPSVLDLWRQQVRWHAQLRTLHPLLIALITLGLPLSAPVLAAVVLLIADPNLQSIAILASALLLTAKALGVSRTQVWTIPCHELLTLASHAVGMLTRHADWGPWRYELDLKARIRAKQWRHATGGDDVSGVRIDTHEAARLHRA
jgi:hypothetical protein